jgi:hypothetical protein
MFSFKEGKSLARHFVLTPLKEAFSTFFFPFLPLPSWCGGHGYSSQANTAFFRQKKFLANL